MNTCGCCAPTQNLTPLEIYNRPGLKSVSYRIGTFGSFRRAMTDAIAAPLTLDDPTVRPLAALTARDASDHLIAVIEMGAYVFDVLTFYAERSMNEALLRTAIHPESLRRIVALLDYYPAPGVAAEALVAFLLEPKRRITIPAGLRVQHVPVQDEKPQKFETGTPLEALSALNKFPILPPSNGAQPALSSGSTGGILSSGPAVQPSTQTVAFTSAAGVEEKSIIAVHSMLDRTEIDWFPAMQATRTQMFAYTRKFRLFGAAAPPTFPSFDGTSWSSAPTPFSINGPSSELFLEGTVTDLRAGMRVLIATGAESILTRIASVAQEQKTVGPISDTVTKINIAPDTLQTYNLTTALVYELVEPELGFENYKFPATIPANAAEIQVDDALPAELRKDRALILDDASNSPQSVTVVSTGTSGNYKTLVISPALPRELDTATAFAWGNVAFASHGETVKDEIVGDGDATISFQTLPLAKDPVTYVRDEHAPNGAASTLRVRINGVEWKEVPYLLGQPPDARVFIARRDELEKTSITFGDSISAGSRAWSGRANITATYRKGLGSAANVPAGTLKNPLDRPAGLKAAINPLPAQGGVDPDQPEETRTKAPNTVRTFDRIVSLRDFEDIALAYPGIAKARATQEWSGEEQQVILVAAALEGVPIGDEFKKKLIASLNARRDRNRAFIVRDYTPLPVSVSVAILPFADRVPETVQQAVRDSLAAFFAFENRDLGQALHLSEIFQVVQQTPGVLAADVNVLNYSNSADGVSHGATADAVQNHLRVFGGELAVIADPIADINVELTMKVQDA